MNARGIAGLFTFLALTLGCGFASAQQVAVGVNLVNEPNKQTIPEQEATLGALQAAGVHVIRAGISAKDAGVAFAQRAYAHGIKILWLVGVSVDGPTWLPRPKGYIGIWSNYPGLSHADPDKFRIYVSTLLAELEAGGIVLAGFELGNEVNWSNGDLSFPGSGKVLNASDLADDPEGQRVAAGYLQYLKLLAVLKDVRDHSKLNRGTPVVSAGLADLDQSTAWLKSERADAVDVDATLNFWRVHGLDRLVDGYGLHFYPSAAHPGTADGAAMRLAHLRRNGLTQCQAAGSRLGKPCWITEWNFNGLNAGACPVDDTERTTLVRELMTTFTRLERDSRIKGLLFYTWQGHIHAKEEDEDSAFRCGALTDSGRLAIAPFRPQ